MFKKEEIKNLSKSYYEIMANDIVKKKEKQLKFDEDDLFNFTVALCGAYTILFLLRIMINDLSDEPNPTFYKGLFYFSFGNIGIILAVLFLKKMFDYLGKLYNRIVLRNDEEYKVAKEVMRNYEIKNKKFKESQAKKLNKEEMEKFLEEEKEKAIRIQGMKEFLKK